MQNDLYTYLVYIFLVFFQVRGAPAIGITATLSLASEILSRNFTSTAELLQFIRDRMEYLCTARPTAVNIRDATNKIDVLAKAMSSLSVESVIERYVLFMK